MSFDSGARTAFAERLALLYREAGNPPLKRVSEAVVRLQRVDERGAARTGLRPADQRLAAGQERTRPVPRPRGGAAGAHPPGGARASRTGVRGPVRPDPVAAPVGAGGGRPDRRTPRAVRRGRGKPPAEAAPGRPRRRLPLPRSGRVPPAGRRLVLRAGAEHGRSRRPAPARRGHGRPGHARRRLRGGQVLPAERRPGAPPCGRGALGGGDEGDDRGAETKGPAGREKYSNSYREATRSES